MDQYMIHYWPTEVYFVGFYGDYYDYEGTTAYVYLDDDSTVHALYFWQF